MSTTDKATPRPWNIEGGEHFADLYGEDGEHVSTVEGYHTDTETDLANVALIVRAVNNLERLCDQLEVSARARHSHLEVTFEDCERLPCVEARALLASARGEAQG